MNVFLISIESLSLTIKQAHMKKNILCFIILLFSFQLFAQKTVEKAPPFFIKSISINKGSESLYPIFKLGETFSIEFDDLLAQSSDYYYQIKHCNADWSVSQLRVTEYLSGFDNVRINSFQNSFNTLQMFTHYKFNLPNNDTRFLVSGNYVVEVLNEDREVVFSRKIIIYENELNVGATVKRTRNNSTVEAKQNLEISIDYAGGNFLNPKQNFKVTIMQNGRFDTTISNILPQFSIGTEFVYKYDSETQFYGGNEFQYFDNSNIQQVNNNIVKITSDAIYNSFLYPLPPRNLKPYSFYEEINGAFLPRNKFRENASIESDYAWVYFNLPTEEYQNKDVYVGGMFNNYLLTDENKLEYDSSEKAYKKPILLKQGFTSYLYTLVDKKTKKIDREAAIDGNFYQTENDYQIVVYYRGNADRADRIIGYGKAKSLNITN